MYSIHSTQNFNLVYCVIFVKTNVEIWYPKVQQQKNGYDYGIYALAFAAEIIAGKDATMSRFNTNPFMIRISTLAGGRTRHVTEPEVVHLVI